MKVTGSVTPYETFISHMSNVEYCKTYWSFANFRAVWKVTVPLPKHTEVYYRYLLIASLDRPILKDDGTPMKVVRHWETYIDPRCIITTGEPEMISFSTWSVWHLKD